MTAEHAARVERRDGAPASLSMYSPLSALLGTAAPLTIPLDAPVREALVAMEREREGAVVVVDPARRVPLGIFTLRDLLRRVTLPGGDLGQPIACVMTSGLITLDPRTTAHQAALVMARNGVRRVVVVAPDGTLAGVVSQVDLFGLQQAGVRGVSARIQGARDVAGLADAAEEIRRFADGLLAQRTGTETLTQYVSTLNDLLTARVIEVTADGFDLPPVPICWLALGSEGRLEQTFSTDQDNGLVFEADAADAAAVAAALVPFARAVNENLAACGFPLCQGGIMAGNPRWCLSVEGWWRAFSRWIDEPEPEALLNASVFFDLRPVWGRESLAERLRERLLAAASDRAIFLRCMAENALRCQPPLGRIRDFVFERSKEFPHTLDLKNHGSRPFVEAARIFALAHGVPHTSTVERLRAVADPIGLDAQALAAIVDGFHFVHLLRLRNQRGPGVPHAGANRVDPRRLNELDRHVLREALRQARRLQARLALDYRLPA